MTAADDTDNENEADPPVSGSFFNEVPPPKDDSSETGDEPMTVMGEATAPETMEGGGAATSGLAGVGGDVEMFDQIIQKTKLSRTSKGFSRTTPTSDHAAPTVIQTLGSGGDDKGSFVGIGKPLNDPANPEYDENGYTLYADETTGERKRVFEALVEYPSVFKMKIVGKDDEEGSFAPQMAETVARSCGVDVSMVKHSKRVNGKWTSVTVHAPVTSADMLYKLYENVDKDPRVKFKF